VRAHAGVGVMSRKCNKRERATFILLWMKIRFSLDLLNRYSVSLIPSFYF